MTDHGKAVDLMARMERMRDQIELAGRGLRAVLDLLETKEVDPSVLYLVLSISRDAYRERLLKTGAIRERDLEFLDEFGSMLSAPPAEALESDRDVPSDPLPPIEARSRGAQG